MHIPFCKQACAYCNFHFSTSLRYKNDLVDAMNREIALEKDWLGSETIETVYFGGGTPSLLEVEELRSLLQGLRTHYTIDPGAEITLEANPDDIHPERLKAWAGLGINRLSIGVQSFFEEELRWMNRAHNAGHARQCIEWSLQEGFTNLTIDLIYGSPLLSDEMWRQNVDWATGYGINHLSCYALTVEEKTPLHKQVRVQKSPDVDSDRQAAQFLLLMEWLEEKGFEHYEVSNFARPGFRSRHNSAYWKGVPYLGIGPSAHSFDGTVRRWNVANNNSYIASLKKGAPERETELLSSRDNLNETVMISLRTLEGLDLDRIEKGWGADQRQRLDRSLQKFLNSGLLRQQGSTVSLTREGMLMADGIASDLFV